MSVLYGVFGYSGFGREVMPLARQMVGSGAIGGKSDELVFIDDAVSEVSRMVNGHRVLRYDEFLLAEAAERRACIAIANGETRHRLAQRMSADGVMPFSVFAANSCVLDANEIGEGAILCGFSHVTSNARIGRHFHANIYSYIAHDCVVGDFVTLAPGAKINGNVVLEDFSYIGTGAVIKQGAPGRPLVIGTRATVGMGAVVTKDVAPGSVVVGSPARPLGV